MCVCVCVCVSYLFAPEPTLWPAPPGRDRSTARHIDPCPLRCLRVCVCVCVSALFLAPFLSLLLSPHLLPPSFSHSPHAFCLTPSSPLPRVTSHLRMKNGLCAAFFLSSLLSCFRPPSFFLSSLSLSLYLCLSLPSSLLSSSPFSPLFFEELEEKVSNSSNSLLPPLFFLSLFLGFHSKRWDVVVMAMPS